MRAFALLALLLLAGCAQPAQDGLLVVERQDNPNVDAVEVTRAQLAATPLVESLLLRWASDRTLGVQTLEADQAVVLEEIRTLRTLGRERQWPANEVAVLFEGTPFKVRVQQA